ncbi:very short patch repair endonuclease [Sphingomonas edaphi]|uniref:Very short patch repair endonuclease n=1 Tax=Sphingomonas edaphi TaxID=2315689 RepID=A0A418Q220_9SPHN|nr:very short patch repair endonuclease [Sphingomonas edaphi]RIX31850.1 DNA mismatch endonuclease Vsr [Sphingomonas edaphi]
MVDVVSSETRSRMMSGIRGRNTRPELVVRRILHASGFRFRLHVPDLPGKPDLVLRRWNAIIHIHGCFWHGHDCALFRLPATRTEFWREKIERNRSRDATVAEELERLGWRQLHVWECALKGPARVSTERLSARLASWLTSDSPKGEIRGH